MKLIKSSYQIIDQNLGLEGIYEQIETAGRLCYKSTRPEGKTAKDFVDILIKKGHNSMLEHGTVYLRHKAMNSIRFFQELIKYNKNSYSKYLVRDGTEYVTTNMRVLIENNWLDDLKYLCEPTEYHEKRVSVHFITSIGIVRELLRHKNFCVA